ncbi:MAG: hypothetical protein IJZ57_05500 [Clostridia bacterium]|nr:hypothetical protein [Clostridia bacterium]
MEITIINRSKLSLAVTINGEEVLLDSKQEIKVELADSIDTVTVSEPKRSFWHNVGNFAVGSVFGLLDLAGEALSMRKSMRLSTKFELHDLTQSNTVILGNPYLDFVSCSMIFNEKTIDGELEITETELETRIKEYYLDLISPLFIPQLLLILFAVIMAVKGIWIVPGIILLVELLIFVVYKKHLISNKKTKEDLKRIIKP